MNCMNCKSVVDVGMEICPNCGFNLRVQRKCFSLSNMYYNLAIDKAEIGIFPERSICCGGA